MTYHDAMMRGIDGIKVNWMALAAHALNLYDGQDKGMFFHSHFASGVRISYVLDGVLFIEHSYC